MKKPFVIGIAGGSASGKSTLAARLEQAFADRSVVTVSMDAYFKPESERSWAASPANGKRYRDDNHPHSFDLSKLYEDLTHIVNEQTADVVIVEGLLTLWDETLCEQLDLKVFVDCPSDVRLARRIRRNLTWGLTVEEIADVYLGLVRYRHKEFVEPTKWHADLIVNGMQDTAAVVNMLAAYMG